MYIYYIMYSNSKHLIKSNNFFTKTYSLLEKLRDISDNISDNILNTSTNKYYNTKLLNIIKKINKIFNLKFHYFINNENYIDSDSVLKIRIISIYKFIFLYKSILDINNSYYINIFINYILILCDKIKIKMDLNILLYHFYNKSETDNKFFNDIKLFDNKNPFNIITDLNKNKLLYNLYFMNNNMIDNNFRIIFEYMKYLYIILNIKINKNNKYNIHHDIKNKNFINLYILDKYIINNSDYISYINLVYCIKAIIKLEYKDIEYKDEDNEYIYNRDDYNEDVNNKFIISIVDTINYILENHFKCIFDNSLDVIDYILYYYDVLCSQIQYKNSKNLNTFKNNIKQLLKIKVISLLFNKILSGDDIIKNIQKFNILFTDLKYNIDNDKKQKLKTKLQYIYKYNKDNEEVKTFCKSFDIFTQIEKDIKEEEDARKAAKARQAAEDARKVAEAIQAAEEVKQVAEKFIQASKYIIEEVKELKKIITAAEENRKAIEAKNKANEARNKANEALFLVGKAKEEIIKVEYIEVANNYIEVVKKSIEVAEEARKVAEEAIKVAEEAIKVAEEAIKVAEETRKKIQKITITSIKEAEKGIEFANKSIEAAKEVANEGKETKITLSIQTVEDSKKYLDEVITLANKYITDEKESKKEKDIKENIKIAKKDIEIAKESIKEKAIKAQKYIEAQKVKIGAEIKAIKEKLEKA